MLDPRGETWASIVIDPVSVDALPDLMAGMADPLFRASRLERPADGPAPRPPLPRRSRRRARVAGLRVEDQDSAVSSLQTWSSKLVAVSADPDSVRRRRLHDAFRARLATADPASGLALAALQGVIATDDRRRRAAAVAGRRHRRTHSRSTSTCAGGWCAGSPSSVPPTGPSSTPGSSEERRAESQVHHAWCVAALATEEAKAWAWRRFRGEDDVPNHELEATGLGFWQSGQEDLLAPYVDRYFAEIAGTAQVRQGWVLGEATRVVLPTDRPRPACGRRRPRRAGGRVLDLTCAATWSTRPTSSSTGSPRASWTCGWVVGVGGGRGVRRGRRGSTTVCRDNYDIAGDADRLPR